jgi:hypothetical protein
MPTSGSRAEFLAVDELGTPDIKYARTGGCFVSTKKGLLLGLVVILAMILVGFLVYYLAICKEGKLVKFLCLSNELKCFHLRVVLSSFHSDG